ncbi:TetR/AcrR family transcriptional regulator [Massilia glaciei]|uniref:TetR/AcrR family transcriptional regulator n=1 Tax=Massilia glaciei TaxID=1524097 RepID=A0A2U2H8Y6_9BURK|nr:TetR/AcrR family transcriptional regulator [Massilia glaciei]PWF39012.1 TetR/AcrR family transcriptional regulator [Massilia glaciei]
MSRERGRPRTFDAELALDRAVDVFWKHGFQNASMQELTEAMGLSKPSLYAAYGDKEALYLKALERYVAGLIARHAGALNEEKDGRRALEGFLRSLASMLADPALPGGCFIINGTADSGGSTMPEALEQALRAALQGTESMVLQRLLRARADGQLPPGANAEDMAVMFSSLIAGMAVLAKSGASKAKLSSAVGAVMAAWPEV